MKEENYFSLCGVGLSRKLSKQLCLHYVSPKLPRFTPPTKPRLQDNSRLAITEGMAYCILHPATAHTKTDRLTDHLIPLALLGTLGFASILSTTFVGESTALATLIFVLA